MILRIKNRIKNLPFINRYVYGKSLYSYYKNENPSSRQNSFILDNFKSIQVISPSDSKIDQVCESIQKAHIDPANGKSFFYSIDPFTKVFLKNQVLDNYSIDYSWVVKKSFSSIFDIILGNKVKSSNKEKKIIDSLHCYVQRVKKNRITGKKYLECLDEIESLFTRPAEHFHEAIQRILFVNQWLWQTGHKHNGFGHLDWILYDLYRYDIDFGYITKDDARQYLREFFMILHEKCWFKSTMLLGDTGQIIILGGLGADNVYHCNELTYLFIEVSKELKLPDPKVLLRVSEEMPEDLLALAIECVSTGIGAPFLSNDDVVIPALIQYGYASDDAYNYGTSACWEPLTLGKSCDQNNIKTINFCKPFSDFTNSNDFERCKNIVDVKEGYYTYLSEYINQFLSCLDEKVFEEDPLLTFFSPEILKTGKDIVRGGAKYANLGVTSVGLSTVVNSLLNLDDFVFEEKKYSLHELNEIRKNDYKGHEELRKELNKGISAFGEDDSKVIALTNELLNRISTEFHKHHTKLGGEYKFGLSSPNYIVDARNIDATFDGRKAAMPFATHISGKNGLAPTELISFASQLDYNDNRVNGNVVDIILPPRFLQNNIDKFVSFLKCGIKQGFYQLQINVVDSKTLIEAQKHPDKFPNLVVRVWGFSAYFKDLPKEYQDNLINRAIEAEMLA